MSLLASTSPWYATGKSIGLLFFYLLTGLFLDSFYFVEITEHAQWYANIVMFIVTGIVIYTVPARNKEQMITAILIAIIGEYLFSIVLGMYTYRLENVPHYVPPGHALVYIAVLYFSKRPLLKSIAGNWKFSFPFSLLFMLPFFLWQRMMFSDS